MLNSNVRHASIRANSQLPKNSEIDNIQRSNNFTFESKKNSPSKVKKLDTNNTNINNTKEIILSNVNYPYPFRIGVVHFQTFIRKPQCGA